MVEWVGEGGVEGWGAFFDVGLEALACPLRLLQVEGADLPFRVVLTFPLVCPAVPLDRIPLA